MVNILVGCTGSVATIKLPILVHKLLEIKPDVKVRIVVTERARHFYQDNEIPNQVQVFTDEDEWAVWKQRGDPVVHIELGKWADLFVIAPLDANTLGKISNGLCDNLLTCTARAWEPSKPFIFCPAMNIKMYQHPLTSPQIQLLESWGYQQVPVIEKTLICGDKGAGAMAEVDTIVEFVQNALINK